MGTMAAEITVAMDRPEVLVNGQAMLTGASVLKRGPGSCRCGVYREWVANANASDANIEADVSVACRFRE